MRTPSTPLAALLCQPAPCEPGVDCPASAAGVAALSPLMSGRSRIEAGGGAQRQRQTRCIERFSQKQTRLPPCIGGASRGPSAAPATAAAARAAAGAAAEPPRSGARPAPSVAALLRRPAPCASGALCPARSACVTALGPLMSADLVGKSASRHRSVGSPQHRIRTETPPELKRYAVYCCLVLLRGAAAWCRVLPRAAACCRMLLRAA